MSVNIEVDLVAGFKAAFRGYPTGVAIISVAGPDGPAGLTASSVASVSVAPPALSFSVMDSPSAKLITAADSLVVNLLGAAHAGLAHDFAHSGGPRFTPEQGWTTLPTGEPALLEAQAVLRCVPLHRVAVGASTVLIASVTSVGIGTAGGRLIYHERRFLTERPTRADAASATAPASSAMPVVESSRTPEDR
ncbi:flavin reductase family protein [Dactylosporangium matsuzakiense]|uniref:Flavin oxidoreductase n=1 Tax=Dactylosporangium matsuzakiense TaxID=53360 RepID=A0A9W6NP51_9ACTN|nr:flavin reductase family protein [Dactylosporangium matsuzakiense]UWZ42622.1 flavin reductase family protein [Dactylosporangium matsuzakiense]GLL03911.1 flavin oxidoreductase [Dactylosporangium matsuzakiense]